jgi:two-component system, response regulator YesN
MAKKRHRPDAAPVVFVVDDEPMLLDLIEELLRPDFDVKSYRDPRQAVEEYAAAKPRPAVVITDYAMGGLNGLDVIRQCRQLQPDQKIVLVSGTVDENVFANVDVKPDGFLAKPYNAEQLVAVVREMARMASAKPGPRKP